MTYSTGTIVTGVTRLPSGGEVRVEGEIVALINDGAGRLDTVILRPTARAQREVGLTDQGIGYNPSQIETGL